LSLRVEIREPHPLGRKCINPRSSDRTTKTREIPVPQIVRKHEHNVRTVSQQKPTLRLDRESSIDRKPDPNPYAPVLAHMGTTGRAGVLSRT